MCLTQGGLALSHQEQAERLCRAGARWIQLRAKTIRDDIWLKAAREVTEICHGYGAVCIINDRVDLALAVGADGVHLGKLDMAWTEARRLLGPKMLLGGTVNNLEDAVRASTSGCLDYVGVGPLRFTTTKEKLAPVLGLAGVQPLLAVLHELPAWIIGGVESTDFPALQEIGAAGAAISSALYRNGEIEKNFSSFATAWPIQEKSAHLSL